MCNNNKGKNTYVRNRSLRFLILFIFIIILVSFFLTENSTLMYLKDVWNLFGQTMVIFFIFCFELINCVSLFQIIASIDLNIFEESLTGEHGAEPGLSEKNYVYPEISTEYIRRVNQTCLNALYIHLPLRDFDRYQPIQYYTDENEIGIKGTNRHWHLKDNCIQLSQLLAFYDLVSMDTFFLNCKEHKETFLLWQNQFINYLNNIDTSTESKIGSQPKLPEEKLFLNSEVLYQVAEYAKTSLIQNKFKDTKALNLKAFHISKIIAGVNSKFLESQMLSNFLILERLYISNNIQTSWSFWSKVESEYRQYLDTRASEKALGLSGTEVLPMLSREHMATFIAQGGIDPYLRFKYSTFLNRYGSDSPLYRDRDAYFIYNAFSLGYSAKSAEEFCLYCSEIPDEDIHLFVGPGHCKFRAIFGNQFVNFVSILNPFFTHTGFGRANENLDVVQGEFGFDFWDRPKIFAFNRWRYFGLFYHLPSLMQDCENYAAFSKQIAKNLPPRPLEYPIFLDCCGLGGNHKNSPRFFYDPSTNGTYVCVANKMREFVPIRLWEFKKLELDRIKTQLMDDAGLLALNNSSFDIKYFKECYWLRVTSNYIVDLPLYKDEFKIANQNTGYYTPQNNAQAYPAMDWLVDIEKQWRSYQSQRASFDIKHMGWKKFILMLCQLNLNVSQYCQKELNAFEMNMQKHKILLHIFDFEQFATNMVSYLQNESRASLVDQEYLCTVVYNYCLLLQAELFWYQKGLTSQTVNLEELTTILVKYKQQNNIDAQHKRLHIEQMLKDSTLKYQMLIQVHKDVVQFLSQANGNETKKIRYLFPKIELGSIQNVLEFDRKDIQFVIDIKIKIQTELEQKREVELQSGSMVNEEAELKKKLSSKIKVKKSKDSSDFYDHDSLAKRSKKLIRP